MPLFYLHHNISDIMGIMITISDVKIIITATSVCSSLYFQQDAGKQGEIWWKAQWAQDGAEQAA